MATNEIVLNTYDCLSDSCTAAREAISQPPVHVFPNIFWAAAILFGINIVIAAGIWQSSELHVNMYGMEQERPALLSRPSPLAETVETKTPKKARQALRMRPVVVYESTAPTAMQDTAYAEHYTDVLYSGDNTEKMPVASTVSTDGSN